MLYIFILLILLILLEIGAYLWHRYSAHLLTTPIATSHQYHHQNDDTAAWSDFLWLFLFYLIFVVIWLSISTYLQIKPSIQYFVVVVVFAWIIINAYVHQSYHRTDSFISRVPGYERWKQEHWYHHENDEVNYGIISSLGDRLFGTYQSNNIIVEGLDTQQLEN